MPTKTTPAPFAARLKSLRERAGLTRYRVSRLTGLHQTYLGRLEAGEQQPSWQTACKLADAIGVSVADLR